MLTDFRNFSTVESRNLQQTGCHIAHHTLNVLLHYPIWRFRSREIASPSGTKFGHKKLETVRYQTLKTRSLYLIWAWIATGTWHQDRQTDGRTDRITTARTR